LSTELFDDPFRQFDFEGTAAFSAASSFAVLSGLSSICAASSRIKWASITENRDIKKRVHPVGASAEINPPGTDAFMVCDRFDSFTENVTGTRAA
jgi:hypothetical protein